MDTWNVFYYDGNWYEFELYVFFFIIKLFLNTTTLFSTVLIAVLCLLLLE